MTDLKIDPNKVGKRLSWFKRNQDARIVDRKVGAGTNPSERLSWYRPTPFRIAVALVVILLLPIRGQGQFGIDTAAILAALSKMQSLMSSYIAAPLRTINQYEQSTMKYEQEVMYPLAAIDQAKTSVTQFENQFRQVNGLFRINVSSATLPQAQSLESIILSRNPTNAAGMGSRLGG